MRREATVAATLLIACLAVLVSGLGGAPAAGSAQPPGLYRAVVTGRVGENLLREQVVFAAPDGRFRDSLTLRDIGAPLVRMLTVFDGHRARLVAHFRDVPTEIEDIHGAPAFVSHGASGPAVVILAAFLTGSRLGAHTTLDVSRVGGQVVLRATAPSGSYRLVVTREAATAPAELFGLPPGAPSRVETEPHLGAA
ncbi:MAG: hypothetical protein ACTHNU_00515 [Gaiellales bacterium]